MVSVEKFLADVRTAYPDKDEFTLAEVKALPKKGIPVPGAFWKACIEGSRPTRFSLKLLENSQNTKSVNAPVSTPKPKPVLDMYVPNTYIPEIDENFVPTGKNYDIIYEIVKSKEFLPCYIYGISGVGKTASVEYACAILKRPFFRVQITQETIDEDLIGSMKLVNGDTVWQDGPVIKAYRSGGVIVLDECDLNPALMILQPILEKKPFYIKQTGELVKPSDGFQVFATGNTKGDGNDARYIGTTTLNEAFLERFGITLEQPLLSISEERKIAKKFMRNENIEIPSNIFSELFKMIDIVRNQFVNQNYEGVYLSTRRIRFIIKAYRMFHDMNTALDLTLARYSDSDREAIGMVWNSVHVEENTEQHSTNIEN